MSTCVAAQKTQYRNNRESYNALLIIHLRSPIKDAANIRSDYTKVSGLNIQQAGLSLLCQLFYPPLIPPKVLLVYLTAPNHLKA